MDWRRMDRATLDRAYDNMGAVADSGAWLARWREASGARRAMPGAVLDQAYGARERNRIDLFPSGAADASLLVFFHGGYWQRNAKAGIRVHGRRAACARHRCRACGLHALPRGDDDGGGGRGAGCRRLDRGPCTRARLPDAPEVCALRCRNCRARAVRPPSQAADRRGSAARNAACRAGGRRRSLRSQREGKCPLRRAAAPSRPSRSPIG
jgi:hypothetical protein